MTALAGLLDPDGNFEPLQADESTLESDLVELLSPLPPADAVDADYRTIVIQRVDADEVDALPPEARSTVASLDLSADDLSRVVSVHPGDYRRRLGVAAGEFDALADDAEEQVDDWSIADDGDVALASVDGLAAFAGGRTPEDRRDTAETMAEAATGEADRFLEEEPDAESAIGALEDFHTVLFVPDPGETGFPPVAGDRLRSLAAGFEMHPAKLEGIAENEYLLFPAADVSLDDETVLAVIDEVDPGVVAESDVSRERDVVRAEVVVEAPPDYDRDAAPNARVQSSFDPETITLSFEHVDGEPVPAEELELWIDGELADRQPADELGAFEPGDTLAADVGPLGTAVLRWFDEGENIHYVYATETFDRDAFELSHDLESNAVEITYVGQNEADPERLTVTHRGADGIRRIEEPFADAGDALADGDSMIVEDVEIEETVRVELDVPEVPGVHHRPLAQIRISPPRIHLHNHPEEGIVARYRDDRDRDAEAFRLLVEGEPADVQFADERDTLSDGEEIPLGEFSIGSELTVEWLEPEEPVTVTEHVVVPRTHASMEYDEDEGTVQVEHRDGDALPADDLELRVDAAPADTQPSDEFDEFAPGDAFAVEVPPLANVELVWVHPEREHRLGGTMTARRAIEARYDPGDETMTLVYVGEQPADPGRLRVRRRRPSARTATEGEEVFAEEYDELSSGDSVEIDAEIGDRVTVAVRTETENATSVRSFGHFATEPRRAFAFREEKGDITAVYTDPVVRDAGEFRLLVDDEPTERQPADVHDDLEREATVDLGEFSAGTTFTAEWTPPAEPVAVGEHVVAPEATFEVAYDPDEEVVEVAHAGGDAIDAEALSVVAPPAIPRPVAWERGRDGDGNEEGEVVEGDGATFDVSGSEPPRMILVLFHEGEVLYREEVESTGS